MNLDIAALEKAYQAVQTVVEQSLIVYYHASEFVPRCDLDGNKVLYKFPLDSDPGYVFLLHASLVDVFCKMVTEAGHTPKMMDWDEYSESQYDLFMKRRADTVITSMVWDKALYDWTISPM